MALRQVMGLVAGLSVGVVGVTCGFIFGLTAHSTAEPLAARVVQTRAEAVPASCGQSAAPFGYIAQLAPGQSSSILRANGYEAEVLNDPNAGRFSDLVAVGPPSITTHHLGAAAVPAVLPPALAAASGLVYPQASEATFRSCDYQLADRPAAQPYILSAENSLRGAGLVTESQAANPVSVYISDDPLSKSIFVVTINVLGPEIAVPGTPVGQHIYSTITVLAIEDASGQVLALGHAPW